MIEIIRTPIDEAKVLSFLDHPFPEMVKFVVDVRQGILAMGGELHADAEALLLENGSKQEDLWGGNYFPKKEKSQRLAYTSMINIRPSAGNRTIELKIDLIRDQMKKIVETLFKCS